MLINEMGAVSVSECITITYIIKLNMLNIMAIVVNIDYSFALSEYKNSIVNVECIFIIRMTEL